MNLLPAKIISGLLTPWWGGVPFWLANPCDLGKIWVHSGPHHWLPTTHLHHLIILVNIQYELRPWLPRPHSRCHSDMEDYVVLLIVTSHQPGVLCNLSSQSSACLDKVHWWQRCWQSEGQTWWEVTWQPSRKGWQKQERQNKRQWYDKR